MLLDHAQDHEPSTVDAVDPFGASVDELSALIEHWGEGALKVTQVLDDLPVTRRYMQMPNGRYAVIDGIRTLVVERLKADVPGGS